MHDGHTDNVMFLVLIVERKKKDAILTAMHDAGIHLIDTVYGKGTVNENYFLNTFGLVPERNKAVITCVSTYAKTEIVLDALVKKFNFNNTNAGIAFTIPVDKVVF